MDLIGLGGRGFFIALFWLVGVGIGVAALQLVFLPLRVPREGRFSGCLSGFLFLLLFFGWIGLAILVAYLLLYPLYRWARKAEATNIEQGPQPASDRKHSTTLNKFSLSDLITIVLAMAVSPLAACLFYGFDPEGNLASIYVVSAIIFPLLYLKGLRRLNHHEVSAGWTRSAFLFSYPFVVYCCLFFFARLVILAGFILFEGKNSISSKALEHMMLQMLIAAVVVFAGFVLAWHVKEQAPTGALQ